MKHFPPDFGGKHEIFLLQTSFPVIYESRLLSPSQLLFLFPLSHEIRTALFGNGAFALFGLQALFLLHLSVSLFENSQFDSLRKYLIGIRMSGVYGESQIKDRHSELI